MTVAIVDTTVIHPLFPQELSGAHMGGHSIGSSFHYADYVAGSHVRRRFDMEHLASSDMDWAMQQMELYRLSRGVQIHDCLIASVCHRLSIPIYTQNQKDFLKILPINLFIKPYP